MRSLLSFVFLLCTLTSFAQDWTRQQVGNGISVLFPHEPEYKTQDGFEGYFFKTTNCAFLVLKRYQSILDYAHFLMLKADSQKVLIDQYLNEITKGRLSLNNPDAEIRTTKIGRYTCKEMNYTDVNPANGKEGKRFTKAIMVGDTLISFECWHMNDSKEANTEKNTFFNSILTK